MIDLDFWHTMPGDQGQIVEVSYRCDWESMQLLRKSVDRSDGCVTIEVAAIDQDAGGESDDNCFEPWNGRLPAVGEWSVQQQEGSE